MTRDVGSFALALFRQRGQPPSGLQLSQPEIVLLAGIVTSNTDGINGLIVAPFLLTPPCQKRKIPAISLKSNPRKL